MSKTQRVLDSVVELLVSKIPESALIKFVAEAHAAEVYDAIRQMTESADARMVAAGIGGLHK